MACNCDVPVAGVTFPIMGLQPLMHRDKWPDYFVPSEDAFGVGVGYYFCPFCKAGLNEARVAAGLEPVVEEVTTSWYGRVAKAYASFWTELCQGIYPVATPDRSR